MSYVWGRETLVFLEIDQPLCSLSYGEAPCQAVEGVTGTRKCYNSRATCQDENNYAPGTLTLRFARSQDDLLQYGNVIPSVQDWNMTPMEINLGGLDERLSAFGKRETVNVELDDHLYDDHRVDKYRLERTFVPGQKSVTFEPGMFRRPFGMPKIARSEFFGYDDLAIAPYTRGTFWGKWLARNPYHAGYAARIRLGYMGQALEDMRVRHYVIDRIEGPTDGQVRVVLKDIFSLVEDRKAVAPVASTGELASGITAGDASATLAPSGIGDDEYPASGYVAIGDEICGFTRTGDVLSLTRGQLNTVAAAHADEDLVQLVLVYSAQLVQDIIYDLLTAYGGIDAALIDKPGWDARAAELTELYTGRISTPTAVNEMIGELELQAGCTVWHNPTTGMIEFAALQAGVASPTVDDDAWIADGRAVETRRQDDKRVSQVHVYYAQVNPNVRLDDKRNYRSRVVVPVDENLYSTESIREVYSRWIPQFGRQSAARCGERLLAMFENAPLEATIPLHVSRDGQLSLAQYFSLETADVQDDVGAKLPVTMAPTFIRVEESEIEVRAQEVTFQDLEVGGERVIPIENNAFNLNLREIHDSIYAAPTGDEVIRFDVLPGVVVGSTTTSLPAMRTGTWPAMATLPRLNNAGTIQGRGGDGGAGAPGTASNPGSAGMAGGDALQAEVLFEVDNTGGEILAGEGGGGGGGGQGAPYCGGGGGGGGRGTNPGNGGPGGFGITGSGTAGSAATADHGGAGGGGGFNGGTRVGGGGGGGGQDGAGGPGWFTGGAGSEAGGGAGGAAQPVGGPGGAGGSQGRYIVGNANVTWIAVGTVNGGVA